MNNTIHTPAPWIYSGLNNGGEISATIFSGKSGELVGTITTTKANLMLMTAAPDLILALETLLSDRSCPRFLTLDEWHNKHPEFRETLRKAKGEA